MLAGALAQDIGEVPALHLEQREEVGVLGHEQDGGFSAPVQVHQRQGVGVEHRTLLAAQLQPDALRELLEQGFLVVEVPVEEPLGDARRPHDVDDPGLGIAALREQLARAVEELLLALDALGGQALVRFHPKSVPRA